MREFHFEKVSTNLYLEGVNFETCQATLIKLACFRPQHPTMNQMYRKLKTMIFLKKREIAILRRQTIRLAEIP